MSTPHQGPGQWEPGNWVAATDYLANLNAQQQRNLQLVLDMTQEQSQKLERMLNKQPLRARIHTAIGNAVARVHQVYDQTRTRLSKAAQTLATQANQYRQAAVGTANLVAQGVAQGYRDVREDVADLAQRGAVAADLAAQRVGEGVNAAGRAVAQAAEATRQSVVQGAQATRQGIVQGAQATGRAVAEGGRQAVAAGQQLAGNVSRWFQDKKAHAQTRAEAARASFAAFRMDPTLPRDAGSLQDRLELSQQFSKIMSAPTYEARITAVDDLLRSTEAKIGATQENPQAEAQNAAFRAFSGVHPPTHTSAPAAATTGQDQSNEQGAQSTVNLNKNPPTKGGPTIG
ncbi:hypothetical protein EV652_102586 [Kribbella steppae]|uniref:Uncharacterized protein n=1 Tax=Kribbella steppae TaxID=2512223 RepID=A0A4V6NN80_9ACTN|nr:hypothetical protein [Kribbella steppae]TCO34520.1 hypothetical protein EV652_102586 [Kribbella steppae]